MADYTTDPSQEVCHQHGVPAYCCCHGHKCKQTWPQTMIELTKKKTIKIVNIINYVLI